MISSRQVLTFLSVACLLLFFSNVGFASCSIPTREQLELFAAQDAANEFNKGFFLGCSVVMLCVNIYVLAKQRRFILMTLFIIAGLLLQVLLQFGDAWASECGNGGAKASYWGYELLVLMAIFIGLLLLPDRLWRKQERMEIVE